MPVWKPHRATQNTSISSYPAKNGAIVVEKTVCRLPQTLSSLKELSSAYPREGFPRQESGDRSAMRRLVLGSIAVAK